MLTLSDAVLRELYDRHAAPPASAYGTGTVVRVVDRTDVFAQGDTGIVIASNAHYTSIRLGRIPQLVRTSQLRAADAVVMPWAPEAP